MTQSSIILFHSYENAVCPDGHAAAWVALKKYPTADILGVTYDDTKNPEDRPLSLVKGYERVILVDFSVPPEVITLWEEWELEIEIIDHHKTAFETLTSFTEQLTKKHHFVFDMSESGATLTWKQYFPYKPVPVFLEYIKDRDLWEHKLPSTKEVHAAMSSIGRLFGVYDTLENLTQEQLLHYLEPIGKKLLEERRQIVEYIAGRHTFETVAGYDNIPLVTLKPGEESYISDVCQHLYLQYPEALFTACVLDGKYSLRSNKDGNNTDVGAIAKQFGGGGHHNAAGFTV